MQKAAEDLKAQQEREAEEKKKIIAARIPKLDIESLSDGPWPPRAVLPLSACNRLHTPRMSQSLPNSLYSPESEILLIFQQIQHNCL
jgi:hypothetical protein